MKIWKTQCWEQHWQRPALSPAKLTGASALAEYTTAIVANSSIVALTNEDVLAAAEAIRAAGIMGNPRPRFGGTVGPWPKHQ